MNQMLVSLSKAVYHCLASVYLHNNVAEILFSRVLVRSASVCIAKWAGDSESVVGSFVILIGNLPNLVHDVREMEGNDSERLLASRLKD